MRVEHQVLRLLLGKSISGLDIMLESGSLKLGKLLGLLHTQVLLHLVE
jgi:hypothetical protein